MELFLKFSPELARIAMAKAGANQPCNPAKRYTPEQIIEIDRRISAMREASPALGEANLRVALANG